MRILCASFYAYSVQGRPKAIGEMSVADAKILLKKGRVKMKNFKTMGTYDWQFVTIAPHSADLLRLYLGTIRPALLSTFLGNIYNRRFCLLGYDGRNSINVCRFVQQFFDKLCGLHVTTNTLRSVVETKFARLHDKGK